MTWTKRQKGAARRRYAALRAKRIRLLWRDTRLTQMEIAKRVGVSAGHVSAVVTNRRWREPRVWWERPGPGGPLRFERPIGSGPVWRPRRWLEPHRPSRPLSFV